MKIKRYLLFITVLTALAAFPITARAADYSDVFDTDGLTSQAPGAAEEVYGDISADDTDVRTGLGKLWGYVTEHGGSELASAARSGAGVLLIAVLCSAVTSAVGAKQDYAVIAAVLAVAAITVTDMTSFINAGREAVEEIHIFSASLLPALTAMAAVSGAVTSAAAKYAASALFLDVLISVSQNVVLPVVYAYTAVSIAGAALPNDGVAAAASFLKWLAVTVLTAVMLTFTVYLSVTGIVTSTADAAAIRVARTTLSTALPVVGNIISDAAGSVLAGVGVVKSAAGVFGILVTAAVCVLPVLRLGARYLIFKAVSGLTGAIADGRISKLIGAVGTAYGITLGMVGSTAVMLFISVISVIKAVT